MNKCSSILISNGLSTMSDFSAQPPPLGEWAAMPVLHKVFNKAESDKPLSVPCNTSHVVSFVNSGCW